MEKLAQDLKKRFFYMVETIKCCKKDGGKVDGEEPKFDSVEEVSVEERGISIKAARGPKRPGVPKGGPPQTS